MLVDRIVNELEADTHDEIILTRLELAYANSTGRGLKEDLSKDGQSYNTLFERGLPGKNGVMYILATNSRGEQVIRRIPSMHLPFVSGYGGNPPVLNSYPVASTVNINPFHSNVLHPGAKYAKVSEIYDACNKELEKDQFGEIPLEFLEELVTESLFTRNILLADANKGHNFANLVQRASGNYIRGAVRDGKLCRPANTFAQIGTTTQPFDEPPPPYRPPSRQPQQKQYLEIVDSDEESAECFNNAQQAQPLPQKYSRFSAPSRISKPNFPHIEKEASYRPGSTIDNYTKSVDESVKERLIMKYLESNSVHVLGNEEETVVQINAMRECTKLWKNKIENYCEFLFTLKTYWLQNRTIDVLDINAKMFDNTLDSSRTFSLDWNMFGITEDDLAPLNLFVRAPKKHWSPNKNNQIEVNPLIQQADFLDFRIDTWSYRIYENLLNSLRGEESIERIAHNQNTSISEVFRELRAWPEIFIIDKIRTNFSHNCADLGKEGDIETLRYFEQHFSYCYLFN